MGSQIDFNGPAGADTTNVGSVFGVDQDVANYGMPLDGSTPVAFGRAHGIFGHQVGGPRSTTVLQNVRSFYNVDTATQQSMITSLEQAGYLDPVRAGQRRNMTEAGSAWKAAVLDAAREGKPVGQFLTDAASTAETTAKGSPTVLTSSLDLRSGIRKAFVDALGKAPDDAAVERMIAAYHSRESSASAAQQAGGTFEAPPSVENFARLEAQRTDPTRFDARSAVKAASVLEQMLGGKLPSESQTLPAGGV